MRCTYSVAAGGAALLSCQPTDVHVPRDCSRLPASPSFSCRGLDWEIVVIDDASPDGTQDVVHQLAAEWGEDR